MNESKLTSLVFIAGLGHSGSTIFDLLLGAQPGITGLGEVDVFLNEGKKDWYLERFDKYNCTCNSIPSECIVWGDFKVFLDSNADLEYGEIYRKLIGIAIKKTGSNIIVDSSKNFQALKKIYQSLDQIGIPKDHFYVIHLVKDIRSYAASSVRAGRSSSILRTFRQWEKSNQEFENFLVRENIQSICVGYDELALSTKYLMERVCSFFSEGKIREISLDVNHTGSHIISGNNMRLYQADDIYYDYRWFNDFRVNLFYVLNPKIRKLNRQWVYSNVDDFLEKKSKFRTPKTTINSAS